MKNLKVFSKVLFVASAMLFSIGSASAQGGFFSAYSGNLYQKLTLHASLGLTGYNGDLAGPLEVSRYNSMMNPAFFVGASYRMTNNISLRYQIGTISLTVSDPVQAWQDRGVNGIRTTIIEPSLSLEFDLFSREDIDFNMYNFNVMLLAGVGVMGYYPYTTDTDQSLRADASRVAGTPNGFSVFAPAILGGLGLQYYITNQFCLSYEFIARFATNDFVDGIGPNNFGTANDIYFTASITAKYTLQPNMKRFNYQGYLKKMRKKRPLR